MFLFLCVVSNFFLSLLQRYRNDGLGDVSDRFTTKKKQKKNASTQPNTEATYHRRTVKGKRSVLRSQFKCVVLYGPREKGVLGARVRSELNAGRKKQEWKSYLDLSFSRLI